tara:strand:- start:17605 stop:19167 length:1563 start_codon:yes stop_codon:yes gene_type:complete
MQYLLIGKNSNSIPVAARPNSATQIPYSIIDPQGMFRPNNGVSYSLGDTACATEVSLCSDTDEFATNSMDANFYSQNSIMSLDGLFSPISHYPTPYSSTFSMAKYTRSKCPICKGQGVLTQVIMDPRSIDSAVAMNSTIQSIQNSMKTSYSQPCQFCSPDVDKQTENSESASQSYTMPPYIIAEGDDDTVVDSRFENLAGIANKINKFNLNPIVTNGGEFSVYNGRQPNDGCVHSIEAVGFGMFPPGANGDIKGGASSSTENYTELDLNYLTGKYQQNQRFMGLRGPVVVHGWGYDQEGYPVPNASGEPLTDANGNPMYDANNNPLYKNQVLQSDGSYSAPYKEKSFYKGWAAQPTTWPVGPIDLRWDDKAGVWTVGGTYREIWVTLEFDLADSTPVRGTIEDDISSADPLPDGFRKLVFVKDPTGMFKAPRGASLYCSYNTDNGFYEPKYNQPFITTGQITSASTANIDNTFTLKYSKAGISETYEGQIFRNPLSLPVTAGRRGMFTFIDGSWNLMNIG